jgi:two-component system LytT family sensor kinase
MKPMKLIRLLDQKRFPFHILVVLLSLIVAVIFSVLKKQYFLAEDQIFLFVLLIIQLELFIFFANRIFRDLDIAASSKEFTRIVLSKFSFFIVICFIIALAVNLILLILMNWIKGTDPAEAINSFFKFGFSGWIKATLGGLFFGAAIFIFIQWQDALKREQKLREENLIFQNETLKNQINPHFLFNCLNTLSSLIASQPEIAENFIIRLSSIYRYILENSSKDRVFLETELSFIRDYFFLHKIRDDEKILLEINVSETEKYKIIPVSLQILVENAIKHNKATREDPLKISIFVEEQNIVVKNNLQKMATLIGSTGIGLKNLKERIRLASGKDLVIEETNNDFLVKLPLFI